MSGLYAGSTKTVAGLFTFTVAEVTCAGMGLLYASRRAIDASVTPLVPLATGENVMVRRVPSPLTASGPRMASSTVTVLTVGPGDGLVKKSVWYVPPALRNEPSCLPMYWITALFRLKVKWKAWILSAFDILTLREKLPLVGRTFFVAGETTTGIGSWTLTVPDADPDGIVLLFASLRTTVSRDTLLVPFATGANVTVKSVPFQLTATSPRMASSNVTLLTVGPGEGLEVKNV